MTPRDNFINFLSGKDYEWTPNIMDLCQFRPAFIPDNVARAFVAQQEPWTAPFGGKDLLGVEWIFQSEAGGSMEAGTLFEDIEDWKDHVVFPDLDAMDWEGCAKENAEYLNTDKLITSVIYTGFFERLISFVGFENAAMALIDDEQQEYVHELFQSLSDFYIDLIRRMRKHFGVEFVEIHDDWGTQISTMFSADTHSEMILPYIQRITSAAREMGVYIEQHSCGKIDDLVPNIIASGVATWKGQPIVDNAGLVERFGESFHFGITLLLDDPMEDEQIKEALEKVLSSYKGKRIWLAVFGMALQPSQHELIAEYIHNYPIH